MKKIASAIVILVLFLTTINIVYSAGFEGTNSNSVPKSPSVLEQIASFISSFLSRITGSVVGLPCVHDSECSLGEECQNYACCSLQGSACQSASDCCNGNCDQGVCSISSGSSANTCGDGVCEVGESSQSCPVDCLSISCGNDICDIGEDYMTCPHDCAATQCGNTLCETGEDAQNCPQDCNMCGNGICIFGESCGTDCALEMNAARGYDYCNDHVDNDQDGWTDCDDSDCISPIKSPYCLPDYTCGNGKCETVLGETYQSCPSDCGGETTCTPGIPCMVTLSDGSYVKIPSGALSSPVTINVWVDTGSNVPGFAVGPGGSIQSNYLHFSPEGLSFSSSVIIGIKHTGTGSGNIKAKYISDGSNVQTFSVNNVGNNIYEFSVNHFSSAFLEEAPVSQCNYNYMCEYGETSANCPSDCTQQCTPDGQTSPGNDPIKCCSGQSYWKNGMLYCGQCTQDGQNPPNDDSIKCCSNQNYFNNGMLYCGQQLAICGNNKCEYGESQLSCPNDCGYPDEDRDSIPNNQDSCPNNPDCDSDGICDGSVDVYQQGGQQGPIDCTNKISAQQLVNSGCDAITNASDCNNAYSMSNPTDKMYIACTWTPEQNHCNWRWNDQSVLHSMSCTFNGQNCDGNYLGCNPSCQSPHADPDCSSGTCGNDGCVDMSVMTCCNGRIPSNTNACSSGKVCGYCGDHTCDSIFENPTNCPTDCSGSSCTLNGQCTSSPAQCCNGSVSFDNIQCPGSYKCGGCTSQNTCSAYSTGTDCCDGRSFVDPNCAGSNTNSLACGCKADGNSCSNGNECCSNTCNNNVCGSGGSSGSPSCNDLCSFLDPNNQPFCCFHLDSAICSWDGSSCNGQINACSNIMYQTYCDNPNIPCVWQNDQCEDESSGSPTGAFIFKVSTAGFATSSGWKIPKTNIASSKTIHMTFPKPVKKTPKALFSITGWVVGDPTCNIPAQGELISSIIDSNNVSAIWINGGFGTVGTYHSSGDSIEFYSRTSNDAAIWSPWTASYDFGTVGSPPPSPPIGRYMQYKLIFHTSSNCISPSLQRILFQVNANTWQQNSWLGGQSTQNALLSDSGVWDKFSSSSNIDYSRGCIALQGGTCNNSGSGGGSETTCTPGIPCTVTLSDGSYVKIPAGAISSPVTITAWVDSGSNVPGFAVGPGGSIQSNYLHFSPEGLSFSSSVIIGIKHTGTGGNIQAKYISNGDVVQSFPVNSVGNNIYEFSVNHFSSAFLESTSSNGEKICQASPTGKDECDNTPEGTSVDETGCTAAPPIVDVDSDGDSVANNIDNCPQNPNPAVYTHKITATVLQGLDVNSMINGQTPTDSDAFLSEGLNLGDNTYLWYAPTNIDATPVKTLFSSNLMQFLTSIGANVGGDWNQSQGVEFAFASGQDGSPSGKACSQASDSDFVVSGDKPPAGIALIFSDSDVICARLSSDHSKQWELRNLVVNGNTATVDIYQYGQPDQDSDSVGEVCDNCPTVFNPGTPTHYETQGIKTLSESLDLIPIFTGGTSSDTNAYKSEGYDLGNDTFIWYMRVPGDGGQNTGALAGGNAIQFFNGVANIGGDWSTSQAIEFALGDKNPKNCADATDADFFTGGGDFPPGIGFFFTDICIRLANDHSKKWEIRNFAPSSDLMSATFQVYRYVPAGPQLDSDGDGIGDACDITCIDNDGDGYGQAGSEGCQLQGIDCNDNEALIYPGAQDNTCDAIDQDCSGVADDGYVAAPTACGTDLCFNEGTMACINSQIVNTCVPKPLVTAYLDSDGDTYGNAAVTDNVCTLPAGYLLTDNDCNDNDPLTNPGANDICTESHAVVNKNCNPNDDSQLDCTDYCGDVDGDGFVTETKWGSWNGIIPNIICPWIKDRGDCNDFDFNMNPTATETCDGIDNNCNGVVDEMCPAVNKGDALTLISSLSSSDAKSQKELNDAIKELKSSLGSRDASGDKRIVWLDTTHLVCRHGEKAFDDEKKAVEHLEKVIDPRLTATVNQAITSIVDADRKLAQTAINEAPSSDKKTKAIEKFNKGEQETKNKEKIQRYREAWKYINANCEKEDKRSCVEEITVLSATGETISAIGDEIGYPNTVLTDMAGNKLTVSTSCTKCIAKDQLINGWKVVEIKDDGALAAKCAAK